MIPIFFFSSLSENLLTKLGPLRFTHATTIHNLKTLLDSIQLMTQEAYHIQTGKKKREVFCLPFLSQKQASEQAHSTTLLLSCIKERKKKKGCARIPRTSGPGRRLSAIYGGAICCNCDICESSWRSIIIIPLLMATVNSVLISSRNP
jgi:hypothetical protein